MEELVRQAQARLLDPPVGQGWWRGAALVGLALAFSPRLVLRLAWLWVGGLVGWWAHALLAQRPDLPALLELHGPKSPVALGGGPARSGHPLPETTFPLPVVGVGVGVDGDGLNCVRMPL